MVHAQRKLPSPGFQLEVVVVEYSGTVPNTTMGTQTETSTNGLTERPGANHAPTGGAVGATAAPQTVRDSVSSEKNDDVFSDTDTEAEDVNSSKHRQAGLASEADVASVNTTSSTQALSKSDQISNLSHDARQLAPGKTSFNEPKDSTGTVVLGDKVSSPVGEVSDFKAMAADASVFTFGDEEDFESD